MKKKILLLGLLLLLIVGGVGFYILSQPPKESLSKEFKEQAVTKLLGRKAQLDAQNIPQGSATYRGKYVTFSYPAKALIYSYRDQPASQSANLEDFSFDIKSPKLVFNMSVINFKDKVTDYPAVRLRELRSEYEKKEIIVGKVAGITFYKTGGEAEKSGFFIKGGKIFTFSATGGSEEEVRKLFDEIILSASFL